jgi:hypothetical protein
MFVGFWPKKRNEMLGNNLWKLLEAFETTDDPILALKRTFVKQGVEGAIALAQSHGEEVEWEKVGSSHARPLRRWRNSSIGRSSMRPGLYL